MILTQAMINPAILTVTLLTGNAFIARRLRSDFTLESARSCGRDSLIMLGSRKEGFFGGVAIMMDGSFLSDGTITARLFIFFCSRAEVSHECCRRTGGE